MNIGDLRERVRPYVEIYQETKAWFLTVRPDDPLVVRCLRELLTVDTRDRILMLAGQGFIAVIPAVIIVATLLSPADGAAVADYVIARYGITGDVADSVRNLFERPPDATGSISLISIGIVIMSVNSYGRSIRRTMERAWSLPPAGFRGAVYGLLGVALLLVTNAAVGWTWVFTEERAGVMGATAASVAVGSVGWLALLLLFLARRHRWHTLLPGALFGGAAQMIAAWSMAVYLPYALNRNADRYGVIGISIAMVTWMLIVATVVVCVSVFSAEAARSIERQSGRPSEPAEPSEDA